ncbi:hypothetical protein FF36_00150 [Frankia torreyi]|uniref:Uncharacterized protein n=1 Tax=Frankia torreyi TaxID=1856 RepID=A0A0D8BNE3_9ACTN|nr:MULTISPECIES: hypothetical protein [Frankia]KJE25534.1 hypothetical protein FF36_00150 [Frankia torreyi]KQM06178.1 hypothetical protein FF86_101055 [Frankia sp. CpI1-P]
MTDTPTGTGPQRGPLRGSRGGAVTGRGAPTAIDEVDVRRIEAVCVPLRSLNTEGLLAGLFDGIDGSAELVALVAAYCVLDHAALLIAVDDFDAALAALASLGLEPSALVPSVIVRARLGERYGVRPDLLDVRLTHASLRSDAGAGRTVEIFMVRRTPELPPGLVEQERAFELERHFAMRLPQPNPIIIEGLRWVLRTRAEFHWDGGGYNPHDRAAAGGTSVLYFLRLIPDGSGKIRRERLEVKFFGDYSAITSTHTTTPPAGADLLLGLPRPRAAQGRPGPDATAVVRTGWSPTSWYRAGWYRAGWYVARGMVEARRTAAGRSRLVGRGRRDPADGSGGGWGGRGGGSWPGPGDDPT